MSPSLQPIHQLATQLREHGPVLLAGMPEPHDELMSLVWGPRFDREHALGLVARQPVQAALAALPALLAAADAFDALHIPAQRRLRDLIRRHRALCAVSADAHGDGAWHGSGAEPAVRAIHTRGQDWGMAEEAGQAWGIAPGQRAMPEYSLSV